MGLESKNCSWWRYLTIIFQQAKLSFAQNFYKIWYSILWEFSLFKLSKEIKDAKGNISMYYKTSLTITRLDLTSFYNMDGIHKTTDTIKKRHFESPQCAESLSIRNNFKLEVSPCFNIQVFSVGKPSHITPTRRGLDGSVNWWYMLTVNWEKKRIYKIIMSTILKNNLQIQSLEVWIFKSECGQS